MTSVHPLGGGGFAVRSWNDTPISRRTTDGYVNATAMCRANGKRWSDYRESDRCQQYLDALEGVTGISVNGLVESRSGGADGGGTWVHPQVAVDLARWISAPFAVWMDAWFLDGFQQAQSVQMPKDSPPALTPEQQGLDWLQGWSQRWGIAFDDRDKLQIKNYAMSLVLPAAGGAQSIYNDAPISSLVYSLFRVVLGHGQLIKLGRLVGKAYRNEFNKNPEKHWQYVDGANREVAHYDREWLEGVLKKLHQNDPSLFQRQK